MNWRPQTMKLLKENSEETLQDDGMGKDFLSNTPQAQATEAQMEKLNHIKWKSFCTAKETINTVKGQPTEWEKIFANYPCDKRITTRIYKELKQLYRKKKTNNSVLKNGKKIWIDISQKKTCKWSTGIWKDVPHH